MLVAVFDVAAGLVALAILLYAGARWATDKGLAAFVLWLIRRFPILSADYRARRVRRRQICPACGNSEKVTIRCDSSTGQVICQCPTCMAMWAYNPVVRPDVWAKLPKVEE